MKLDLNAAIAIVALTAAAVSAVFTWRIDERDSIRELEKKIADMETTLESKATATQLNLIDTNLSNMGRQLTNELDQKLESSDLVGDEFIKSVAIAATRSEEFSKFAERIIPKGAVVAFDVNDDCPEDGWSRFAKAQSRTIVGAAFSGSSLDPELTPRAHDDKGGSEEFSLSVLQMPSHAHAFSDTYYSEHRNQRPRNDIKFVEVPGKKGSDSNDTDNVGWQIPNVTEKRGNGESVSLLPPYIALYYCIRN